MGFAFLELVQQDDGEVILREGPDQDSDDLGADAKDPLVRIKFSPAILEMLDADAISLAEVMIEAATRALAEQNDDDLDVDADDSDEDGSTIRLQTSVLH